MKEEEKETKKERMRRRMDGERSEEERDGGDWREVTRGNIGFQVR